MLPSRNQVRLPFEENRDEKARVKEKEEWKKEKKRRGTPSYYTHSKRERIMKYDQLLVKWEQNVGYRSSFILFKGQYWTWNDHFV